MLRIVRWCGVLCAGVVIAIVTGCAQPRMNAVTEQQPSRYLDCGPVASIPAVTDTIGTAGGSVPIGDHLVIFPPGALRRTHEVTVGLVPRPNSVGIELRLQPAAGNFRSFVTVVLGAPDGCTAAAGSWSVFRVRGNASGPGKRLNTYRHQRFFHSFADDHSFFIVAD